MFIVHGYFLSLFEDLFLGKVLIKTRCGFRFNIVTLRIYLSTLIFHIKSLECCFNRQVQTCRVFLCICIIEGAEVESVEVGENSYELYVFGNVQIKDVKIVTNVTH